MTKESCKNKAKELINSFAQRLEKEVEYLMNSGAIDFEKYEEDYQLPRIFVAAASKTISGDYQPFSREDKEEVKNLSFI
jgi:hypothetical protein